MIESIEDQIYLGSSSEERFGIGSLIRGKSIRATKGGLTEMECLDGEWIRVYYAVILTPGKYQSSPTTIKWI